jgi:hypothetical protein
MHDAISTTANASRAFGIDEGSWTVTISRAQPVDNLPEATMVDVDISTSSGLPSRILVTFISDEDADFEILATMTIPTAKPGRGYSLRHCLSWQQLC